MAWRSTGSSAARPGGSLFAGTSRPTASPARARTRSQARSRASRRARASGSRAQVSSHMPGPCPPTMRRAGTGRRPGRAASHRRRSRARALAGLTLVLALRRQGEVRLNLGVTCAALLGVFGIGAVAGALFATRAAPHGTDRATAQSGHPARGLPGPWLAHGTRGLCPRWVHHADRVKVPTELAAAPQRDRPATSTWTASPIALALAPAISPVAPPAPLARPAPPASASGRRCSRAARPTYVVKPGDSLSDIARTQAVRRLGRARRGRGPEARPAQPRRPDPVRRPGCARGRRGADAPMNALPDSGVGSALRRLRTLGSLDALFREAAQALCENLGFDRAAVFSVRGRELTLESTFARDAEPKELEELAEVAADPPPLGPGTPRVGGAAAPAGGPGRRRQRPSRARPPSRCAPHSSPRRWCATSARSG